MRALPFGALVVIALLAQSVARAGDPAVPSLQSTRAAAS
jgi:hypothetical protein